MKSHKWTPIAPEEAELGNLAKPAIWQWCIKCGALKLKREIFLPGPKQGIVINSCDKMHARNCRG